MDRVIKYGSYVLLGVFVVWFFFNQGKQQEKLRKKMEEIENGRKKIEQEVMLLKSNTDSSETRLQNLLLHNNEIIDTLNTSLRKLNKSASFIDKQIDSTENEIDKLLKDKNN